MSQRVKYLLWVGASVVAGLVVGLLARCGDSSASGLGLALFALLPALLLAPLIHVFGGHAAWWVVLTILGVALTYVFTFIAYLVVVIGALTTFARPALNAGTFSGAFGALLAVSSTAFLGGAALGVLQLAAIGRASRWRTWIIATMVGSAAVGPIAYASVLRACDPYGASNALVGAIGGLVYGIVTAMALGMRLSTWTSARPLPLPPSLHEPR